MSNVFKKLQQARVILQEKNLKKSGSNKFAGFNYFELADFLPTLNLIMDEIGLTPVFYIVDSMAFLDIYDNDSDDVSNCIHFSNGIFSILVICSSTSSFWQAFSISLAKNR